MSQVDDRAVPSSVGAPPVPVPGLDLAQVLARIEAGDRDRVIAETYIGVLRLLGIFEAMMQNMSGMLSNGLIARMLGLKKRGKEENNDAKV